jgi:bifunctional NMN adenylyltransferase/nudix hydrolase
MTTPASTAAVVIGRFPLCLHAHTAMLERALAESSRVVVFVRAAFHPRIPRDPFTWEERAQMIMASLRPELRERHIGFMPARDYSDDARWAAHVMQAAGFHGESADVRRVRLYVEESPAWRCPDLGAWQRVDGIEANEHEGSRLLAMVLQAACAPGENAVEEALGHVAREVAPAVLERLRAWTRDPGFEDLAHEQQALDAARAQWRGAPYEPIFSTVDCVVHCARHVLLVRRKHAPGRGQWALPGGFVEPRERLRTGAIRELIEETAVGVDERDLLEALREARVFDQPDRSQRGRSITHAHFFDLGERELPGVMGSDDAAEARWVPLEDLPALEEQLFEDHFQILDDFLRITS